MWSNFLILSEIEIVFVVSRWWTRLVPAVQPKISPSTWIIIFRTSEAFKNAIVTAVQVTVFLLQEEITNLIVNYVFYT